MLIITMSARTTFPSLSFSPGRLLLGPSLLLLVPLGDIASVLLEFVAIVFGYPFEVGAPAVLALRLFVLFIGGIISAAASAAATPSAGPSALLEVSYFLGELEKGLGQFFT